MLQTPRRAECSRCAKIWRGTTFTTTKSQKCCSELNCLYLRTRAMTNQCFGRFGFANGAVKMKPWLIYFRHSVENKTAICKNFSHRNRAADASAREAPSNR